MRGSRTAYQGTKEFDGWVEGEGCQTSFDAADDEGFLTLICSWQCFSRRRSRVSASRTFFERWQIVLVNVYEESKSTVKNIVEQHIACDRWPNVLACQEIGTWMIPVFGLDFGFFDSHARKIAFCCIWVHVWCERIFGIT